MWFISILLLLDNSYTLAGSFSSLQEGILHSPFKALLHRSDGKEIMAYLYAEDEKSELREYSERHTGEPYNATVKIGHFKIYLYDVKQKVFLPGSTPVFKDADEFLFNGEGATIMVFPGGPWDKSDVLLISQFGTGEGDIYEAYGFSSDNLSLKNYVFNLNMKEKTSQFYGTIGIDGREKKVHAYTVHQKYVIGGFEIVDVDMSLSKTPGEIDLKFEEPKEEKKSEKTTKKIRIERYENWSHPVLSVFKKYDISLYKVSYSKDGTYPIFYVKFKHAPDPKTPNEDSFHQIYFDVLKANYSFPYAFVDEEKDLRIKVGWEDKARTIMSVDMSKANSP